VTVGYAYGLEIARENRSGKEANEGDVVGNEGIPGKIFPVHRVGEEMVCSVDHAVDGGSDTHRNGEQEGTGSRCDTWMVVVVERVEKKAELEFSPSW
jgi:hypothetical protein